MDKEEQPVKPDSSEVWLAEIQSYRKEFDSWGSRGDAIVKRYRDERGSSQLKSERRYNILWSNIQTLRPAVFSKTPKPNVSRRFSDKDDVSRCASRILERSLLYEVEQYTDFFTSVRGSVIDRLLPGRGTVWVRYEPEFGTIQQEYTSSMPMGEMEGQMSDVAEGEFQITSTEEVEIVTHECCPTDYVFWKDFAHSPARTWGEVTWVARRAYLSYDEGVERFGKIFANVPKTSVSQAEETDNNIRKKAAVWEVWDKESKKVIWVAEKFPFILDKRDDPLELDGFFPCPEPLYATLTTDTLVPVPDYAQYQNQATEMDDLTDRIYRLQEALKVVGVYDASTPELAKLLKSEDNTLVPVKDWAALVEKGGLANGVQFVPVQDIASVLMEMYKARESVKQIIYEITGISDIIRGASVASETATAQAIKSQFASLRLNDMRDDVERFCRDILRIKAEIICTKYQPDVLKAISGIDKTEDAQFADAAIQLLKDDSMREYSIDIETESLVKPDKTAEQQNRVMFLQTAGTFLQQAIQAGQQVPELSPLLGEMLMFGIRGFKTARPIEAAFEQAMQKLQDGQGQKMQQQIQQLQEQLKQVQQHAQQAYQAGVNAGANQIKEQETQVKGQEAQIHAVNAQTDQYRAETERGKAIADAQERMM